MRGFLAEKLLLVSKERILRFSFCLHHHFSSSLTSEFQDWQIEADSLPPAKPALYRCPVNTQAVIMTEKSEESTVRKQVLKALGDTAANQREGFETCF